MTTNLFIHSLHGALVLHVEMLKAHMSLGFSIPQSTHLNPGKQSENGTKCGGNLLSVFLENPFMSEVNKTIYTLFCLTLYSPHIVCSVFGLLESSSQIWSQVAESPTSGLVMFPVHMVQLLLPVPKYPALHTTMVKKEQDNRPLILRVFLKFDNVVNTGESKINSAKILSPVLIEPKTS